MPLEIAARSRFNAPTLASVAHQEAASFARVRRYSRWLGRKVVFATNAGFLVERARRRFGMPDLQAHPLPNPVPLPELPRSESNGRPFLLMLGRLQPQKRPWIAYELARRIPEVDFVLAGKPTQPELMEPALGAQSSLPNLKRVGAVDGKEKAQLLGQCAALLNTSIHEGLPISFLEAFSYGKPVISCLDPDGVVQRFGYLAPFRTGMGLDADTLDGFERAIRDCLSNEARRRAAGYAARRHVEQNHTFEAFDRHLQEILRIEGLTVTSPHIGHDFGWQAVSDASGREQRERAHRGAFSAEGARSEAKGNAT